MDTKSVTPEAQSEMVANSLLKKMKKTTWNIPDQIQLFASGREMVLGRCHPASVIMHSPRLPAMISRKHAVLTYNSDQKQWTVEDLKVICLHQVS